MNQHPLPHLSASDFYSLRDDRTDLCVSSRRYQTVGCSVHVSPAAANTLEGQAMLLASTNLLSRWCRKVTILLPATSINPLLGFGEGGLGEFAIKVMRDADPFGDFQLATQASPLDHPIELCIGGEPSSTERLHKVFINASGWRASLSRQHVLELPRTGDHNVLGAIAAACLGVAQVFKAAVGASLTKPLREGVFDLFLLKWDSDGRQASWSASVNVGSVLMVGAGSVGSSAAYCMRMSGLAGCLSIVDKDPIKLENLNRSPLFNFGMLGEYKATAIANFLSQSAVVPVAVVQWWHEFLAEQGRKSFTFDTWLPLANEYGVRNDMQHHVPPLMIHASTTSNWGVNHGRHIPGRDDCLADRFPGDVSAQTFACSTGPVVNAEASVDAALPFASLFAGLLIVAELVRAQLPDYPQVPNFALFDFLGPLECIQAWDRRARAGCICRDQGAAFHQVFNSETRHAKHFRFS